MFTNKPKNSKISRILDEGSIKAPTPSPQTIRSSILASAASITNGDRDKEYGSPEDSFERIANLWTAFLGENVYTFTPSDVAILLALLKVARLANTPSHRDSWVDLAGYAACGAECELSNLNP